MTRPRTPLTPMLMAAALALGSGAAHADDGAFGLHYSAHFEPAEGSVAGRIEVEQSDGELRELDLDAPESEYRDFSGDGKLTRDGDRLKWQPPKQGGALNYRVGVDHKRHGAYDARMTDTWAILRLDDLFPRATSRTARGAHSEATLMLTGPEDWSFETPYGPMRPGPLPVETEGRRLDRPVGWLAAGDLGTRRTQIAGREFVITGPKDQGIRRLDTLAFLRWTVPELSAAIPTLPDYLLLVAGTHEMWRGGLSGPRSLYLHPDRPMISGNSTSAVLHELMHVATEEPPADGDDWIAEGIAEYYGLLVLRRTDGISEDRFQRALDWLKNWADEEGGRLTDPSTGPDTARAVLTFHALAEELDAAGSSIDAVAGDLLAGDLCRARLITLAERELGEPSRVLADALQD